MSLYCKHPISNLMHDLFNRTVLVNVLNVFQETSFVTLTTIEHLLQDFCCQTFRLELNKLFFLSFDQSCGMNLSISDILQRIQCFHMTSRFPKQENGGHVGVPNQSCGS